MLYSGLILAVLLVSTVSSARIGVCIRNCGQCKQMFGHYFHGQACAESCLASKGFNSPDCNNPKTLRGLIVRLYR
ncbi:eclosion hormone isoform X2 [Nilaparvata lugens]|uniref:Eclosion hormone 2 n=1 Tax=Nilaparvata lugens TaxID=108931 RepID=U3U434_NILLU|nr:eclosion hormone isoform X2 [Nilaparvata lugens]BAO00951.1 eclosion hormone 2 [Nilaparvata lugens]